jgi:hypothetical protein
MAHHLSEGIEIITHVQGRNDWRKFSFPVSYGIFTKIKWKGYEFDFSLRGHLKRISGNGTVWPNPLERMKRTDGNDFLYYGMEGYESTFDLLNAYYFPHNEVYRSPLSDDTPIQDSHVRKALSAFDHFLVEAEKLLASGINGEVGSLLKRVTALDRDALAREGAKLHRAMGGPFPILPPDTINVDYEVIPLRVMDGCPHDCGFCRFKADTPYRTLDKEDILDQLRSLKLLYGEDLINYNSLVLGENNALAAGGDLLEFAAVMAFEMLSFNRSFYPGEPNLFLFGSAALFLKTPEADFRRLNALPYNLYLNLGLESPDEETLTFIGKKSAGVVVREAFQKALHINRVYPRINVTSNFILGKSLPSRHVEGLKALLGGVSPWQDKGTVYLSPLIGSSDRRQILKEFREIKRISSLPVYLYLMQRL